MGRIVIGFPNCRESDPAVKAARREIKMTRTLLSHYTQITPCTYLNFASLELLRELTEIKQRAKS